MLNKLRATLSLMAGVALANSASAAQSLKIGDLAPKLQVGQWVQGEPVKGFETGKVYVVEFWATWCGPCRVSIPHLNALYQQYKDKGMTVIGQDVWEQDESGVAPFVKKMGTNMTYRVALDDKSHDEKGAMAATWMEAAGRDGIPSAFIVNQQGRIAWIGHPMEMTEKLWDAVLSGHYDVNKAAADYETSEAKEKQLQELAAKLDAAVKNEKWDDADATVAEIEKASPENAANAEMMRFQILLTRKKYDDAYKLARSLSDAHGDDARLQNALAWILVTGRGLEKRDPGLAEKIADRANKAADGKEPEILDTLARAQFMNGKTNEAVATEQKALDLSPAEVQSELKNNLQNYRDGKLPGSQD